MKKNYGLLTAITLVIANMVGTGVFGSLGFQLMGIKSGFAIIMLWLIGGLVALFGALSYSELGAAIPRSGGEYHFLSKIYHHSIGFTAGWISFIVGFAAPIAAASFLFGDYLSKSLHIDAVALVPFLSMSKILAIGIILLLTVIHMVDKSYGAAFQNFFTAFKIIIILVLVVAGLAFGHGSGVSFSPGKDSFKDIISISFAISMYFVSYAYSGWNASAYIAGEIKNPQKNLPLSLITGTIFVTFLYIMLNFVFMYTTPVNLMVGNPEVGFIFANHVMGAAVGKVMGVIIALVLISTISAMIIAGPRVSQVIGEDFKIFSFFSIKNKKDVPWLALVIQSVLAIVYLMTSTFEQLIVFIGFTLNLFTFLTVLGVIIFRIKKPDLPRPYKTFGYPVVPILFLIIQLWIMYYGLRYKTVESLWGIGISLVGLLIYFLGRKKVQPESV